MRRNAASEDSAPNRGKLERRGRSVTKTLHATANQAAHAGRGPDIRRAQHGAAVAISQRTRVAQVPGELLDEEHISKRLLQDVLDETSVRFNFDHAFDDRCRRGAVQAPELDGRHLPFTLELGNRSRERLIAPELPWAVGPDDR